MDNLRMFVYCRITHPTRLEPIKVPAKLWDNCNGNWFEQRNLVAQIAWVHLTPLLKELGIKAHKETFNSIIAFAVM